MSLNTDSIGNYSTSRERSIPRGVDEAFTGVGKEKYLLDKDKQGPIAIENRFDGQEIACSINSANTSPIMAMLADDPSVEQICAPVWTPVGSAVARRSSGNSVTMPHPPDMVAATKGIGSQCTPEKERIGDFLEYASKKKVDSAIGDDDLGLQSSQSCDNFQESGVFVLDES